MVVDGIVTLDTYKERVGTHHHHRLTWVAIKVLAHQGNIEVNDKNIMFAALASGCART